MKKVTHYLLMLTAALFLFAACKKEEKVSPTPPQISSDVSMLAAKFGETKTITISVSAAGKIKDITATTTIGTIQTSNLTGIGAATGTVTITFNAPYEEGTGKITVIASDQGGLTKTSEIDVAVSAAAPVELTAGDVEGVWGPNMTYIIRGNIKIPKGKSLTIKEGVTVIVEGDGTQANSPEISVYGKLYSYGTEQKPVLITVAESKRTEANTFAGLWGGICGVEDVEEMAIIYTRIEYVGAPAPANSPMVTTGEVEEGDPRYSIYFNNPKGRFVMMHSTIANSKDDGMRINQGQLLVAYNTYINTGRTGGEALNVKSGCTGDVAYNTMVSAATNGLKCSNSDDRSPQTDVNIYNNTIVNSGWRQTKSGRGGSVNLEKGGRGKVYNNMIVNCRYGVRFPKSPDNPDIINSFAGYNYYFGNSVDIAGQFYPSTGSLVKGDLETANDISGNANENDPKFVNFNISGFDSEAAKNSDNIKDPGTFNLKLQAGSPALGKGKTGFSSRLSSLTIDGKTYSAPAPSSFIGSSGN